MTTDVFHHLAAEARFLAADLATHAASAGKTTSSHSTTTVEALLLLSQFPPLFQPVFSDLIDALPIDIAVDGHDLTPLEQPSEHDSGISTDQYAHHQCIHHSPNGTPCPAWNLTPYVTDTFFRGLARVLASAANPALTGADLEAELATGFRSMFCHHHDEPSKTEQARALAAASRPVVEQWRCDEQRWRREGKKSASGPAAATAAVERQLEWSRGEISRLLEENHRLREEGLRFGEQYRHEH